jgi:hypothetical protein
MNRSGNWKEVRAHKGCRVIQKEDLWFKSQIINSSWTCKCPLHFYWAVHILSHFSSFEPSFLYRNRLKYWVYYTYYLLGLLFGPEDGGNEFIQNSRKVFRKHCIRSHLYYAHIFIHFCTVVQRPLKETLAPVMGAILASCCDLYYQTIGSSGPFHIISSRFLHDVITASYLLGVLWLHIKLTAPKHNRNKHWKQKHEDAMQTHSVVLLDVHVKFDFVFCFCYFPCSYFSHRLTPCSRVFFLFFFEKLTVNQLAGKLRAVYGTRRSSIILTTTHH